MNQLKLKKIAEESIAKLYEAKSNGTFISEPFQYCCIDNFLPEEFANEVMNGFPDINSDLWDSPKDHQIEIKHRTKWTSEFDIPDAVLPCIRLLNSAPMLKALSEIFNIPK